jgi:putative chitinase
VGAGNLEDIMGHLSAENLVKSGLADAATAGRVAGALESACQRFGIDTGLRLAGFLSQCAHESSRFRVTQENLNYGASRLVQVWPKRFDGKRAVECDHKPERIANIVYADRLGNGPEASGDGWRFRGRGFIQLTGRSNYEAFEKATGVCAVSSPDLLIEPGGAAVSAAWFWSKNGLNKLADAGDVVGMTKRINGGTLGLEERKKLYAQALAVFG